MQVFLGFILALLLTGCSVDQVYNKGALNAEANWALLPVVNQSQTPQAGERAEAILMSLLHTRGITHIGHYPMQVQKQSLLLMDNQARYQTALKWAISQGYRYGITGTVEEWRYKAGLDGEPAVGITLKVLDLKALRNQQSTTSDYLPNIEPILWSATGARTGWGREGVAVAANKLLNKLLDGLSLKIPNK
jgi:hypothetical protein